jgi:hypothetical protein
MAETTRDKTRFNTGKVNERSLERSLENERSLESEYDWRANNTRE